MMTLIEGHEGAMNLISSIDGDIAAEIDHLTTKMDGSEDTVVAGSAASALVIEFIASRDAL